VKRRWRLAIAAGLLVGAVVLVPIAYIEESCRAPLAGYRATPAGQALLPSNARRPEARTFLTYPEWHIVYEAEAYGRHLAAGRPPSAFPFAMHIGQFWSSYCTVNRLTAGGDAAGDAKVTIYTIGISYTVELAVKAAYEWTIGRLFEWASGWHSADDRHAAHVQQRYGAFMHETPWYRFAFGEALSEEWQTSELAFHARHWERRFALSAEYGVKALYAKAVDSATGATIGRDELTLRFVAHATPAVLRAIDNRLKPIGTLPGGLTVVEAPRYQQFNDLLAKLAAQRVPLVEIAGNHTIFMTLLVRDTTQVGRPVLIAMPVDRPGWKRIGIAVPVTQLTDAIRQAAARGGTVEHVYDY
jgi:hypothetical protein